ncbi:hypothetical protein OG209_12995 [Streptomyces sp. NBC_01383]
MASTTVEPDLAAARRSLEGLARAPRSGSTACPPSGSGAASR